MTKREEDARFLKSEKLLVVAATEEIRQNNKTTVAKICKRAGVFRSTFYRHYRSLNDMTNTHKHRLLEEFNRLVTAAWKKSQNIEHIFRKWALFLYQNRDIFRLSVAMEQFDLLMLMMKELRPLTTIGWRSSPQKLERVYLIYSYEVIGVWLGWAKNEDFDANKILLHTQELSFLTRTALQRLGGIGIPGKA